MERVPTSPMFVFVMIDKESSQRFTNKREVGGPN